jgi:hypothetical protein
MKKLTLVVIVTALGVFAQGPGRPGFGGPMGPGGPPMRTIAGAPYSGVEMTTTQQVLAGGNTIQNQHQTTVYRDSQGRVRTETVEHRPGANNTTTTTTHITITDPVAGVMRHIDNENRAVTESPLHPAGRPGPPPNGAGNGPGAGRRGPPPNGDRANMPGGPAGRPGQQNDPNVKTETLGVQTLNGVAVNGTRTTHTIPAGAIGNAQAMQSVREVWTSVDLKVPVMVKETDPRFGTTVTELTNIVRAEPDATLFQAPAGYTVRQGGPGPDGRPGRGGPR